MKILMHWLSGLSRSLRCLKWILLIWFANLFLVTLLTFPLKTGIKANLGQSMISEKIAEGYFIDVIANSGFDLKTIAAFFLPGFFILTLFGALMNIFFAGGLFNILRKNAGKKSSDFFGGAGSNFWSFLGISVIVLCVAFFLALIITGIPAIIVYGTGSEKAVNIVTGITGVIFLILLAVVLIIADYARVWQAASEKKNVFRAIGKGIKLLSGNLFRSYLTLAPILFVQALTGLILFRAILYAKPESSEGIFLLFLLGQLSYILKIFIRSWRYATVTDLYELQVQNHLAGSK